MSLFDYKLSQKLSENDPPFAALIMAALRKADSENSSRLWRTFPEICREMQLRYNAPGGVLEDD